METLWDALRRLTGEAETLLRSEEEKYVVLKAQQRELLARHEELVKAALAVIVQPCSPDCKCPSCTLLTVVTKCTKGGA